MATGDIYIRQVNSTNRTDQKTITLGSNGQIFGLASGVPIWGYDKVTITHTFTVNGTVAVPSGDTDFIIPMTVSVPSGAVVTLIGARAVINSGTSVTCNLQRGTTIAGLANITGYTTMSVTTTLGTVGSGTTTFNDNDLLVPVVTAVSGTPKNMMFSVKLEYRAVFA